MTRWRPLGRAAAALWLSTWPAVALPPEGARPPSVLVLRSGRALSIRGGVAMEGRLLVFHIPDGTLVSLKAEEIDEAATATANAEISAGEPGDAVPAPHPGADDAAAKARLASRITLDLKDADLVDVLRLLTELAGVNLVVSDDVSGALTMRLADVTLEDALSVVLKTMGLGIDRSTRVYRVAPMARMTETLRHERALQGE